MGKSFMDGFALGCLKGCALAGVAGTIACIWLGANGYTLTRQPPEPVLAPIDCRVTA